MLEIGKLYMFRPSYPWRWLNLEHGNIIMIVDFKLHGMFIKINAIMPDGGVRRIKLNKDIIHTIFKLVS